MGFRINTNIAAMNAHTNATMNNRNIDKSLGRLSSGLRINTAADDASGMVIANALRSQASSLAQAVNNGNDAIGLIQTADGALDEYSKILDTIKTKAIQAASDGQNTTSRLAIQKDIDRLMENLGNIAGTTSFNGQKLLSGTFINKEFQMGANANESVKASIASAEISQVGQTTRAELRISQLGENQLTVKSAITGESILLESFDIKENNDPDNGMGHVAKLINKFSGETGITAKAIVTTTTDAAISAGITGPDFAINGINIGAINVTDNDTDGTLLTAINNKTTETGVSATKTEDGKITLTANDGRAIRVTGDMETVMGTSADDMSTVGHLEVVQAGSSTFQIFGAETGVAVGEDITTTGTMTTIQDSILSTGSVIVSDSTLAGGTTIGVVISGTVAMALASSTKDDTLAAGSIIGSGSKLEHGTELGGTITTRATTTLTADMFIVAGSTLGVGTVFDAGTILQQDMSVGGVPYKAGTVLAVDLTLLTATTLTKDMTISIDISAQNSAIGASSSLLAGTVLGEDLVTTGTGVLAVDMVAKAGSSFLTGTNFAAGTTLGDNHIVSGNKTTTQQTDLALGSLIGSGSTLKEDSTVGGELQLRASVTLNQDMRIKAGSLLVSDTVLKAGTVIDQDLTAAQVGGGAGSGLKAGTVLGTDVTLTDDVSVIKDFTMLRGTSGTNASIALGSKIAPNGGDQNSAVLSNEEFTNLSDIEVTTLESAMKAIDTVSAAIGNLDSIRSDLGSAQNQIVSIINNISITQVNVKAAESQIRDVDFAAESANFSKLNILAQSGSYAMAQANSVQQNVLSLLQ